MAGPDGGTGEERTVTGYDDMREVDEPEGDFVAVELRLQHEFHDSDELMTELFIGEKNKGTLLLSKREYEWLKQAISQAGASLKAR